MVVPTFPGGARQAAEPVLGDLHQTFGRGTFRRRGFSPRGVFLPEVEVAFLRRGGQGAALLIRRGTAEGNVAQLEDVTKTHFIPLPRAKKPHHHVPPYPRAIRSTKEKVTNKEASGMNFGKVQMENEVFDSLTQLIPSCFLLKGEDAVLLRDEERVLFP